MFVNTIFELEMLNQQKVAELTAEVKEGALLEKVIRRHLSSYTKDLFVPKKICFFRHLLQWVVKRLHAVRRLFGRISYKEDSKVT